MKNTLYLFLCSLLLTGCIEEPEFIVDQEESNQITPTFDFKSVANTKISISLSGANGNPYHGVKVNIWSTESDSNKDLLFTAFTNKSGQVEQTLRLPTYLEEVVVETNFIGIPNSIVVPIVNNSLEFIYEFSSLKSTFRDVTNTKSMNDLNVFSSVPSSAAISDQVTFNYIGSYNRQGVPSYLEPERDMISETLLQYINASLPESQPVPEYKPSYLADGKKTTLDIVDEADVWVTFVHEGAGFKNAIGFYTYQTGTPPQRIEDISQVNVVFPNLSFAGSGGGLYSGDKVNIGRFQPGTSIGLVLLADGWDGADSEDYYHMVYADRNLNPETDPSLQQHNVLLWDDENDLFLIGFEDILRDNRPFQCDNDFNDAILLVTSNPVEAISIENVSPINKPGTLDNDGDGINDILDEYPNDPNKAYDSYYPSSTSFGTFAFEDNWPDMGDYDFNDLVVDYQFKHVLNANNQVVRMEPSFKIRAAGAGYRNGFGFATNLNPGDIVLTTGQNIKSSMVFLNANGTEANQSNAVFIVTTNVHDHFNTGGFINTAENDVFFEPVTVTLEIDLLAPKSYSEIGSVPYNPFVIISQNRGREVHLPGYEPTDLVDFDYFGTSDDNSNPAQGIYYRSRTDLPWGIHLPESFDYPKEKSDIRAGHLRFNDWAKSFGYSYLDWYRNQNGYRSNSHLYNKD